MVDIGPLTFRALRVNVELYSLCSIALVLDLAYEALTHPLSGYRGAGGAGLDLVPVTAGAPRRAGAGRGGERGRSQETG